MNDYIRKHREKKSIFCEPGQPAPSASKASLNLKKTMLCIHWDIQRPIHYEFLIPNDLNVLYLRENRPALINKKHVIPHQYNVRLWSVALATRQKIAEQLGNSVTSTILPRPSTLWISLVSLFAKLFTGKKIQNWTNANQALIELFVLMPSHQRDRKNILQYFFRPVEPRNFSRSWMGGISIRPPKLP